MPRKLTTEQFIEKAKSVHGDKYDYSKVEYANYSTKVCIICPKHGEFWQLPLNHLKGKGCPNCYGNKKMNLGIVIEHAQKIHGNLYDYSKSIYKNTDTKMCIICPKHGEFWQTPYKHINCKRGCPTCGGTQRKTTSQFIEDSIKVHGKHFDYSEVEYINNETEVCIICPKHGKFWITPAHHLSGRGCPLCKTSNLEYDLLRFLEKNKIIFEHNKFDILGKLQLDFYIPSKKVAIECQGEQHFRPIDFFGGQDSFEKLVQRDAEKRKLCEEHGVKLLYYSNLHIDYPYKVYEDKDELLKEILGSSETS